MLNGGKMIISNIKKIKEIAYDKNLNEITNKLPENTEVCKSILSIINNKNVVIESDENTKTSLYIALSNKILIANIKDTFTRIQTIAHECIHSIQSRKLLLLNFCLSNVDIIYFIFTVLFFIITKKVNCFIYAGYFIVSLLKFLIRNYLEVDAMTRAKPLAEKYMKDNGILSKDEIKIVVDKYDEINKVGIMLYSISLFSKFIIKNMIICSIILYFTYFLV